MASCITIVDYGMGNIGSVVGALKFLGIEPKVTPDPEQVKIAHSIILPGVGSFRKAMEKLKITGLDQAILETVKSRGGAILGICLGMQLLGAASTEDGESIGLALVPNRVDRFATDTSCPTKIPHVGFNTVRFSERKGLFSELPERADFYFVHSYRMLQGDLEGRTAICDYGGEFLAAFETDRICGTQFHPEKSQTNGLILLKNFIEMVSSC